MKSAYAEAFIPIVGDGNAMPGIQELSLSAAVRHDDYSDFGGTTNPKLALRYVPVEGLSLRATFGKSFRAPTLSDIDPQTLTISFNDFVSPTGPVRTLWVRGGNPDLGPEKATIWSVGGDYEPEFLDGLKLSLTYFKVDYKNRIETPGNDTLALSTPAREALLGSLVVRNPSVDLVNSFQTLPQYTGIREDPATTRAFVDGRKVNVGQLQTDGLEGVAQFATEVGEWEVNAGVSGTYLFNFKRAIAPAAALVDVVDTINNPLRFRARGNFGLGRGGFDANAFVNYSAGYVNNSLNPAPNVGSYTTVDLSLRQKIESEGLLGVKDITFSLDVQNLFDRDPPVVVNGALAFDPQVASILGRFFQVGVRATW